MRKWAILLALVLLFSSISVPKAQAGNPCDYFRTTHYLSFSTPQTLPDNINTYAASTWFRLEVTYFTPGSPAVTAKLYKVDGSLIGTATLSSAHPSFIWDPYPWMGCVYVQLTSAEAGKTASGSIKVDF